MKIIFLFSLVPAAIGFFSSSYKVGECYYVASKGERLNMYAFWKIDDVIGEKHYYLTARRTDRLDEQGLLDDRIFDGWDPRKGPVSKEKLKQIIPKEAVKGECPKQ
jgi:hypothetical protein